MTIIVETVETVTLSKDEYDILIKNTSLLEALYNTDVEHWGGWNIAYNLYLEYQGLK